MTSQTQTPPIDSTAKIYGYDLSGGLIEVTEATGTGITAAEVIAANFATTRSTDARLTAHFFSVTRGLWYKVTTAGFAGTSTVTPAQWVVTADPSASTLLTSSSPNVVTDIAATPDIDVLWGRSSNGKSVPDWNAYRANNYAPTAAAATPQTNQVVWNIKAGIGTANAFVSLPITQAVAFPKKDGTTTKWVVTSLKAAIDAALAIQVATRGNVFVKDPTDPNSPWFVGAFSGVSVETANNYIADVSKNITNYGSSPYATVPTNVYIVDKSNALVPYKILDDYKSIVYSIKGNAWIEVNQHHVPHILLAGNSGTYNTEFTSTYYGFGQNTCESDGTVTLSQVTPTPNLVTYELVASRVPTSAASLTKPSTEIAANGVTITKDPVTQYDYVSAPADKAMQGVPFTGYVLVYKLPPNGQNPEWVVIQNSVVLNEPFKNSAGAIKIRYALPFMLNGSPKYTGTPGTVDNGLISFGMSTSGGGGFLDILMMIWNGILAPFRWLLGFFGVKF